MHELDYQKEIELFRYILVQVNDVLEFCEGFDEDKFLRDELVKNATLMKLIVIGEYSNHVDQRMKSRFSEIEWQLIKAARNYYAHVYRGVNWKTVWEVVVEELPAIKPKFENIIAILEKENNAKTN